jgi:signal transduction histidine kinase
VTRIYTGEVALSQDVLAALETAGLTVVNEAAPPGTEPTDLIVLNANYAISSELRHSVNNPLTAVLGFSELALRAGGLEPRLRDRIEEILANARLIRALVQRPEDL